MSDFEAWWPEVQQTIGKVTAKVAWDEQQKRIDELEAEVEQLRYTNTDLNNKLAFCVQSLNKLK